jgi:K+-sensing histidine kinase KdpD
MSVADRRETIGASAFWLDTWPRRYGCALIAVAAAALLRYYLYVALGFTQPFILFYPTIMLIALLGELGPGLFATLFSAVLAAYLFLEPLNSFAIRNSRDIVGLVLFAVMGVAISGMGALFRRRGRRLQEFEGAIENLEEMITVVPITVFNQDRDLRYTGFTTRKRIGSRVQSAKRMQKLLGRRKPQS